MIVSRNLVLISKNFEKLVDFVNNSGYFTEFCVISLQNAGKAQPKKEEFLFFQKKEEIMLTRGNCDLCPRPYLRMGFLLFQKMTATWKNCHVT